MPNEKKHALWPHSSLSFAFCRLISHCRLPFAFCLLIGH
jgi:hypothetical protein